MLPNLSRSIGERRRPQLVRRIAQEQNQERLRCGAKGRVGHANVVLRRFHRPHHGFPRVRGNKRCDEGAVDFLYDCTFQNCATVKEMSTLFYPHSCHINFRTYIVAIFIHDHFESLVQVHINILIAFCAVVARPRSLFERVQRSEHASDEVGFVPGRHLSRLSHLEDHPSTVGKRTFIGSGRLR
jgi:hypothetical protein